MMAESSSSGDDEFKAEAKYKQFSAAVERALKAFEVSSEWHDLISSLARLNKTLLAYKQYPAVPHHLMVSKRLSQCLHPNLPGGVHLKALDVYKAIFDRIGTKGLLESLLVYSSGLFPLLGYSSMSVRPTLLDIYERYYLSVGQGLVPCLPGMVLGLLPGLEDESEHTERITRLLEALCVATDEPAFYSAVWQCVLGSERSRLPAVGYVLSKLNKKATAEDQIQYLGGSLPLMVSALCAALQDKSVLVSRTTLDVLLTLFPLHRPFLVPSDIVLVLSSALETLLRRDMSLNRRLFSWLLGTQVDKSYMETHFPDVARTDQEQSMTTHSLYFERFTRSYLISAVRSIISTASQSTKHSSTRLESVLPYRLLRTLMDKPEIGDAIVADILPDVSTCLKIQVETLGGIPIDPVTSTKPNTHRSGSSVKESGGGKKSGKKSHKVEILQSANLFFNFLTPEQLWQWMESLLGRAIDGGGGSEVKSPRRERRSAREDGEDGGARERGGRGEVGGSFVPEYGSHELLTDSLSPGSPVLASSESVWPQSGGRGSGGGGGVQLSCASACRLVCFLLQILPLDSMEDVYIHHLPHLLWHTLHALHTHEAVVKPRSLQHCLELLQLCTQKLLQEPASASPSVPTTPVSTPSTPAPSLTAEQFPGAALAGSALSSHTDKLKWKVLTQFSAFFSKFIANRVAAVGSHGNRVVDSTHLTSLHAVRGERAGVSGSVERCFVSCCQLLCSLACLPLSQDSSGEERDSMGTMWLPGLKSVCTGAHDHHMTFTALETLLTLLAHSSSSSSRHTCNATSCDLRSAVGVLCPDVSTVARDESFLEAVTLCLWDCLCPSLSLLHVEASSLLWWTHSLSLSLTSETTLLRQFASESIDVYQRFSVLWQHSPVLVHNMPCRPFNRALLRMVEGLQSRDSAVRSLVQAWVHSATTRGDLHRLLEPLVRIILEQDGKRKVFTGQLPDSGNGLVEDAGKYYYDPKSIEDDVPLTQEEEIRLLYTQLFDTDQVVYALSLLQALLMVDPPLVIRCLAGSVVNVGVYAATQYYDSVRLCLPPGDQQSGQKSLLEIILLSLVSFLRSEYPDSLEVSPSDEVENLRVKAAAVEIIGFLVLQFSQILSSIDIPENTSSSGSGSLTHNPSYISALVTLCDVQKVLLLALSQVVKGLRECTESGSSSSKNSSPKSEDRESVVSSSGAKKGTRTHTRTPASVDTGALSCVSLKVLFVHLLRCVQNLVSLEMQCIPSSPVAMTPGGKQIRRTLSSSHRSVQPGLSTTAQPFFQSLLMEVLANPSLLDLHSPLLHMLAACLPNLHNQLDDLAPKILRQLCQNLETTVTAEKAKSERTSQTQGAMQEGTSGEAVVCYVQALADIILWCMFGEYPAQRVLLRHNLLNRFWDASRLGRTDDSEEVLSPTSKQPSAMSWLFGVFATATQNKAVSSPVGTKTTKLGLSQNRAGHSILLLLPAVYNALTEVWTWFSGRVSAGNTVKTGGGNHDRGMGGGGRRVGGSDRGLEAEKKTAEFEDVHSLVSGLLGPLAVQEPSAFLSTVSTVWLEWDLGTKVNPSSKKVSKRKDAFIAMLHHIQVLSLEQFIRSVQFSFTDLARSEDHESSVLRQKYLLHFFYKYISSPLQSWEELAGSHVVMVLFLRDCYSQCYNGSTDSLLSNCHLLCMLTSILHVFICRVPGLEKKQKKERKELQDLTHKLCEALSLAAGCSSDPPPPSPPPTRDLPSEGEEGFEVVEHADLHTTAAPATSQQTVCPGEGGDEAVRNGETQTRADSQKDGVGGREGVGGRGSSGPSTPSLSVTTTSAVRERDVEKEKELTAGLVRSAIAAQPPVAMATVAMANVAGKPAAVQTQRSVTDPSALPGAQALAVLANTVSHFIDSGFGSSEKERILALLKVVLHNVWPHLQNHSTETQKLYHHSVKLLSSLSGFQATRKVWRRETFDLFMANNFFIMELGSLLEWKVLVDNLMTQDKTTFRDLLTRLAPGLAPGLSNMFTTSEQEGLNTARVVKRMAFAILSAEPDQYTSFLPDIQEKLSDCGKLQRHPALSCAMFLTFRTLLLKFSSTHLMSFWPAIVAETLSTLCELEADLSVELRQHRVAPRSDLHVYLSVSKLLDTAWSLPPHFLSHFQFLQWGFSDVGGPHSVPGSVGIGPVSRICALFSTAEGTEKTPHLQPALSSSSAAVHLHRHNITSLRDLKPFYTSLPSPHSTTHHQHNHRHHNSGSAGNTSARGSQQQAQVSAVEKALLQDFLEPFLLH